MAGIRNTKSVQTIMKLFDESPNALSIVDLVKRHQDIMNKTTVYRILKRLEENKLIHSFIGTNGTKWYAKTNESVAYPHKSHHPHFHCTECGNVECLPFNVTLPSDLNKKIDSISFLLSGQCKDCIPKE